MVGGPNPFKTANVHSLLRPSLQLVADVYNDSFAPPDLSDGRPSGDSRELPFLGLYISAGIRGKLRSVQPVHLIVEPGPQECPLFAEHLAVTLETILLVNGVQRILPGKVGCCFELG